MDSGTLIWVGVCLIVAWMFRGLFTLVVIAAGGALAIGLLFLGAGLCDLWTACARQLRRGIKVARRR